MKRYRFALGILIAALAVSAVLLVQRIKAADPTQARVRVVHAVPGGPTVDLWVDGSEASTGISYTTVTTYVNLSAGPHTVQVIPSLLPIPIISETVVLTGGMDLTIAGVGQGLSITSLFLEDNNSPSNSNTARLVHLSPDTSAIDVAISGTVTSATASNIAFKGASDYIGGLGVGMTSFEVRPAGQITPLLTFSRTLGSDTINTFFIMGLNNLPGSLLYPLQAVHSVDQRFIIVYLPVVLKGG